MYSLFDDINQFDEGQRISSRQAVAVANKRVQDTVGGYLRLAKTAEEYTARLDFVTDDIRQIVADVSEEFGVDHDKLKEAIERNLEGDGITDLNGDLADAPSAVGVGIQSSHEAGGHKDGCECGFCKNKGKLPGSKKDEDSVTDKVEGIVDDEEKADKDASEPEWSEKVKESSVHQAEAPRDGGGATKRVSLPKGDGKAVGTGASPKIDRKEWKPNALYPDGNLPAVPEGIEMDGSPNPTERQDLIDEDRDYSRDFNDKIDAATTTQELPSADPDGWTTDKNLSQEGQMGTWTEAQGDAVTPQVFAASVREAGFVTDDQVQSAIDSFDGKE